MSQGSLIQLQVPGADQWFFLGMLMKRPQTHILIEGILSTGSGGEASTVTISQPPSQTPTFYTSHQVFHDVLTRHPTLEMLPFVVHSYRVNAFASLHNVELTDVSGRYQFSLKSCSKPKAKPKPKQSGVRRLVLGTPRKRKRKAQSGKDQDAKKAKARRRGSGAQISLQELVNLAEKGGEISSKEDRRTSIQRDDMEDDLRDEFPDLCGQAGSSRPDVSEVFDPQSESESSSSETDAGSLQARSSPEQGSDSSDDDDAVEKPFLTAAEAKEERETEKILASHRELMNLRGGNLLQAWSGVGSRGAGCGYNCSRCNPCITWPYVLQPGSWVG